MSKDIATFNFSLTLPVTLEITVERTYDKDGIPHYKIIDHVPISDSKFLSVRQIKEAIGADGAFDVFDELAERAFKRQKK